MSSSETKAYDKDLFPGVRGGADTNTRARVAAVHIRLQGAAGALALIIAAIHIVDQGGIPGSKTPTYVGLGYWILELAAIGVAAALFTRSAPRLTWVIALGVASGPLIGYILSRGPGLPSYTDDKGNWTEPLGLLSVVAEGLLVLVAVAAAWLLNQTRSEVRRDNSSGVVAAR